MFAFMLTKGRAPSCRLLCFAAVRISRKNWITERKNCVRVWSLYHSSGKNLRAEIICAMVGRRDESSTPAVPDRQCALRRGRGMEVPADTPGSFPFLLSLPTPTALVTVITAVWGTRSLVSFRNLLSKKKKVCKEGLKKLTIVFHS